MDLSKEKIRYLVGIDGGENNGYCVIDRYEKKIKRLHTLKFWELISKLKSDFLSEKSPFDAKKTCFIVEDPNKIQPNFQYNKKKIIGNISIYDRISQNIGMCKQTTKLIIEYIVLYDCLLLTPPPKKSKIDKNTFIQIINSHNFLDLKNPETDYFSYSQHAIDSFMIIYHNVKF